MVRPSRLSMPPCAYWPRKAKPMRRSAFAPLRNTHQSHYPQPQWTRVIFSFPNACLIRCTALMDWLPSNQNCVLSNGKKSTLPHTQVQLAHADRRIDGVRALSSNPLCLRYAGPVIHQQPASRCATGHGNAELCPWLPRYAYGSRC